MEKKHSINIHNNTPHIHTKERETANINYDNNPLNLTTTDDEEEPTEDTEANLQKCNEIIEKQTQHLQQTLIREQTLAEQKGNLILNLENYTTNNENQKLKRSSLAKELKHKYKRKSDEFENLEKCVICRSYKTDINETTQGQIRKACMVKEKHHTKICKLCEKDVFKHQVNEDIWNSSILSICDTCIDCEKNKKSNSNINRKKKINKNTNKEHRILKKYDQKKKRKKTEGLQVHYKKW